eukprot:1913648-Rhodomonas_salina.2
MGRERQASARSGDGNAQADREHGKPTSLDEKSMSGLRSFLRTHSTDLALGVKGVEVQMVDPKLRIAGTADLLARGITGGLTIVDWKRSDKDLRPDSWSYNQVQRPR